MVMDEEVAGDDGMTNASGCSIEADFAVLMIRSWLATNAFSYTLTRI